MNEIAHILSPSSAPWCGWIMLALLLCAVLSEAFQPGVILQAKNSLSAQSDRMYKESPATFMGQLMIGFFRVGTIAMAIYLCCANEQTFTLAGFGVVYGIVLAVLGIKMLCHLFVDYTFSISRRFGAPYEHYGNIATLATIALYPVLLVLLRVGFPILNQWLIGSIGVAFLVVWFYHAWKQFVAHPIAIPYMLIYSFTLEFLPWAALYVISDKIVAII